MALAQDRPAFEVASIRPNPGAAAFSEDIAPNGRFSARNLTLWNLIRFAFNVRDSQIVGGPEWINKQGFDIEAQPPQTGTTIPREQLLQMMQGLLEDRFQLQWHRESRDQPAYAIVADRNGVKLAPPEEGRQNGAFGDLYMPRLTLDSLCNILEFDLDRPVVNRTGIAGEFAIRLQWYSQKVPPGRADPSKPALSTALQEQLGLRLESTKAPIEMLVIDRVEKPSDN